MIKNAENDFCKEFMEGFKATKDSLEYSTVNVNYLNTNLYLTDKYWVMGLSKEMSDLLNFEIWCYGEYYESVEEGFKRKFKEALKYYVKRSDDLDKWKPFQFGTGSLIFRYFWFTIFGFHFYISYRESIEGINIPFTKVNIVFRNEWRNKTKK